MQPEVGLHGFFNTYSSKIKFSFSLKSRMQKAVSVRVIMLVLNLLIIDKHGTYTIRLPPSSTPTGVVKFTRSRLRKKVDE
jgi:hypothetical protein